jgi:hypothetical protein
VWLDGHVDAPSILGALRRGESFVSASPSGPQLYLARNGDDACIRAVDGFGAFVALVADGIVVAGEAIATRDAEIALRIPRDARYVRAQLVDGRGNVLALTNRFGPGQTDRFDSEPICVLCCHLYWGESLCTSCDVLEVRRAVTSVPRVEGE